MLAKNAPPVVLVLHCGGNDKGNSHTTLLGTQKHMKCTIVKIQELLPKTVIKISYITLKKLDTIIIKSDGESNCCRRKTKCCRNICVKKGWWIKF